MLRNEASQSVNTTRPEGTPYICQGQPLVVSGLRRISESQPTAWEGVTPQGYKVHVAYLFGTLSIEVRRPSNSRPECFAWEQVASFKPGLIQAELATKSHHDRYAMRLLAERNGVAEIRRANEIDMRANSKAGGQSTPQEPVWCPDGLRIRDETLLTWMSLRNRHLIRLMDHGIAGGTIPVDIQFHYIT